MGFLLVPQKMSLPQISKRKISRMAAKSWNSRKFSPSKVFHNTVSHWKGWLAKIAKHIVRLPLLTSQSIYQYDVWWWCIRICITHTNIWESMGKPCSCMQFIKSRILYYKSHESLYQYCKSCALRLNIQRNRRFVWWNHYHHSTKLYRKQLCTRNNTDGNKLMIFSSTPLYYGDTGIFPFEQGFPLVLFPDPQ